MSPFLYIVLIFPSFPFDGRRPVSYDALNIIDNTGAIDSANSYSIFALVKSSPGDLPTFKSLSFFSMAVASEQISLLSGKVFSSIFHLSFPSIVKTLLNSDANASALS